MRWALLLVTASLSVGAAQSTACETDYHCDDGYCDLATQLCTKCLHCEDFKRNPPLTPVACIKTVSQCGACFEGLSESAAGDLLAACAPATGMTPMYVWFACGALALFAAILVLVVCVLRNKNTFRILTSTATSVRSPCRSEAASAPELPPPYNALYSPVRPDSPPAPPPTTYQDAEAPLLKGAPPAAPARESAGAQAANVYNNPAYVRGPQLPANYHEEREDEPAFLHDESTAESPWTPADTDNNANDNSDSASGGASAESSGESSGRGAGAAGAGEAPALPALLAASRGTVLLRPPRDAAPPAKVPRLQQVTSHSYSAHSQDTNNNRDSRERDEDDTMSRGAGPTFNIHVNVQQVNDLKL